jgi:ubiquinone biosynthesis monooxygenase Coq7
MDKKNLIHKIIRVNHAGEFGAKRIYEGQLKFLKNHDDIQLVKHMYEQELEHLKFFEGEIVKRDVRPTIMTPIWNKLGFALGAVTAIMGKESAMACTVAVEEVIEEHYQNQIDKLKKIPEEEELCKNIEKIQAEEAEHREIGIENDAEKSPGFLILTGVIKRASKCAIWLSERV